MALDKVLSASIANGAVTAALISNTANLVVNSVTANVLSVTTISGLANVTGDMIVGGNLTVSGTMTYINTTDLNIGDAIISLNADLGSGISPTEDAGISINRGASTNAQFKWIESTDNWSLGNTTVSGIFNANDTIITGSANVSVGINVGANVNLSTTYIDVGNSTVNTTITNITVSTNTVNVASIINIGANVSANTTALRVGNSTVNTSITSTSFTSTSNTVTLGTAAYVVANGNVGIGTASPAYKVDVNGTVNANGIQTSGTPSLSYSASKWMVQQETANQSLMYVCGANSSTYGAHFLYRATSTGTPLITMSYAANGNIGVGIAAPESKLHVFQRSDAGAAPNTPEIRIEHQDINAIGTGGSNGGILNFVNIQRDNTPWANNSIWGRINFYPSQPTSGTAQLGASILAAADGAIGGLQSASYLAFYTSDYTNGGNTGEKMRIDSSGNLGIGSTSPANKLDVRGILGIGTAGTSSLNSLTIQSNVSSAQNHTHSFSGPSAGTNDDLTFYLSRGGGSYGGFTVNFNGTNRFFIPGATLNNNGDAYIMPPRYLGIGTTSPVTRLSINTSTQNSEAATIGGIDYGGTKRGLSIRTFQSLGGDDCGVEFNAAPSNSGYGSFKFNAASTTLATLGATGSMTLAGSIFPAASHSYSISTSSWSANTFYTIITPGSLANYTTYWVTARWDHGGGGGPFIMACAFMFSVVNTNGSGVDNTFTPLNSSHTGGGGILSFRSIAALGATTGLQASANSIVPGTMTVNLYRFV